MSLTDDRLPWCPTCETIAVPTDDGDCGDCGSTVILSDGGAADHPTGYFKRGYQHNLRFELFGIQLWVRFHRRDNETRLYGDIYKKTDEADR